jgi:hypothetical protein
VKRDEAAREADRVGKRLEAFHRVATRISDDADLPAKPADGDASAPAEPFAGSADDASSQRETVREEIRAARELHDEAIKLLQQTADKLRVFANDDAFDRIGSLRRTLQAATVDTLAAHAEEWQEQLTARLRSLDTDLAEIDRHRKSCSSGA